MPTATFVADFTKWNEGLRNAQAGLKPLEVSAKGVQAQLKAMATSLSGVNIQKQAQLATAAVQSIGGATKLTESEQKRLNATLTEAIAKYQALGQKAPADMIALAKATKQVETSTGLLSSTAAKIGGVLAGAFAVGTITRLAGDVLQFASDLNDLSAKTGISVEALQEFKFAGDAVGVTLDDVSTAILGMQKNLVGGGAPVDKALKTIGLTFKDLQGLRPEDQFSKIASALSKIEDPAIRNRAAFDLMGKSAAAVLPLIASDLDAAREKARSFGAVLDQDTINKLDDLGDTWAAVKVTGEAFIAKALVPLAPAATQALNALLPLAAKIGELPALFIKAEIAATEFAKKQADDAIKFLSSPAGKLANPLGSLTGQTQKEIGTLRAQSFGLANDLTLLHRELDGIGKGADGSNPKLAKFNTTLGETKGKADPAADALAKLRDELTGANIEQGLRALQAAWDSLTPAEQKNALAIGVVQQKYVDLASKLPKLPDDLRKFAVAMNDAADSAGLMSQKVGELKPLVDGLGPSVDTSAKAFKDWGFEVGFEATIPIINLGKALKETEGFIDRLPDSLEKSTKAANIFVDAFAKAAERIPDIIIQGILHGSSGGDIAEAVGTEIGGDVGQAIGTAIGGQIGGAIGKTLGSLLGPLLRHLFKDRAAEEVGSIGYDFGVKVSKDFAQGIEDQAKSEFGGNRQATKIFDLDQIISQGGGITTKNLDQLTARLHDVYSLIETGAFTADQAQSVLDKNFQTFVDFLGGKVSPALKDIIRLNDEFGTHSKAIAQYVDAQANTALDSLKKVVDARQSALDNLANAKTPEEKKKAQAKVDALPLTPGSGAAFGGALFGIFERLQKDGVSAIDTLKQIEPVIESLDKQFAQAGISGGAAFDQIKSLAGIATDEIAGPSFEAIQNYGSALEALNNAGILTQDQFTGLTDQITATYNAAVDALTKEGKDGSQALGLVQPQLQEIWELQQDFGYAVDDSTQKLLDQAVAAGEVGEKHRSVQEQTLDVMKHLDAVLSGIGEKFGVDIPNDVDKTTAAFGDAQSAAARLFNSIPDHVDVGVNFTSDQPPGESDYHDSSRPYSSGGVVYAARGLFVPRGSDTVPAMLTPGEFVMSRPAVNRIGASVLGNLNRGVGVAGAAEPTTVILQVDGRELARAIATPLPGEVRRLGVRVRT